MATDGLPATARRPEGHSADEPMQALLDLLDALEHTLQAEVQALREGDIDALAKHTATKQGWLRTLAGQLHSQSVPLPSPAAPGLLERLQRCHSLNQSTGAAIMTAMRHNAQVLSMLGQDPGPVAYTRGGPVTSGIATSGRSLASA